MNYSFSPAAVLLLSASLLVTGCTKDTPSPPEIDKAQLANAMADFFVDCTWKAMMQTTMGFLSEADPNYPAPQSPTREEMRAQLLQSLEKEENNSRIVFNQEAAQACVDIINEILPLCETQTESTNISGFEEHCLAIFVGTQPVGAPCARSECAPNHYCAIQDSDSGEDDCGVCAVAAQLGEPCGEIECAQGLNCSYSQAGDSTCVQVDAVMELRWSIEGDECSAEGMECGLGMLSGYYCDAPNGGTGVCKKLGIAEEGETCNPTMTSGSVCRYLMTTHHCALDLENSDLENDIYVGICAKRPDLGDDCDEGLQCNALTSYCDSTADTCSALKALGEPCDRESQCGLSNHCDGEPPVCVPNESEGDFSLEDSEPNPICE